LKSIPTVINISTIDIPKELYICVLVRPFTIY
jgi:hypothetical protein